MYDPTSTDPSHHHYLIRPADPEEARGFGAFSDSDLDVARGRAQQYTDNVNLPWFFMACMGAWEVVDRRTGQVV